MSKDLALLNRLLDDCTNSLKDGNTDLYGLVVIVKTLSEFVTQQFKQVLITNNIDADAELESINKIAEESATIMYKKMMEDINNTDIILN